MKKCWLVVIVLVLIMLFMMLGNVGIKIESFEDCVNAGYPVMESYPRQCSDGKNTWTEDIIIGGDTDEHGCLIAAGYSWCESKSKCIRVWEDGCGDCEVDSDCLVYGKDGDCNCGCYNKESMPTISGGECYCAAPISCECINNNCEGIFE